MEAFFSTVKNEVGERYESHGEPSDGCMKLGPLTNLPRT